MAVHNRVTDAIVRYRKVFFIGIAFLYLVSFNGRWRIGLDSSIYRGLAHNLASGNGYAFGESAARQVYPGLPILLAGIERYISTSVFAPVIPLLVILVCSILILSLTYKLVRQNFPEWVAVAVTCGVAINQKFLQLSSEILTDIPFLLGVMSALYGWNLLRVTSDRRKLLKPLLLLLFGLALAAVMRPTFWIVALAWLLVCIGGLFTRERRFYAIALLVLIIVSILFTLVDPRTSKWNPFSGGYERELLSILQDPDSAPSPNDETLAPSLLARFKIEAPKLMRDSFPESFLGQNVPWGTGWIMSIVLIGATLLLMLRQPLWALIILLTLAVTSILSTTPRYYLMVLPAMLLGWTILLATIAARLPRVWGEVVLLVGFSFVTSLNISKLAPFVVEQRSIPFYEKYRSGKMVPTLEMAQAIEQNVEPGKKVLGPSASILEYLSGRKVVSDRDILPAKKSPRHWPDWVAKADIDYAVFPAREYRDKDEAIARLMERGVIRAADRVASTRTLYLATVRMRVPEEDWRNLPLHATVIARQKAAAKARQLAATRPAPKKKPTSAQIRRWQATTRPVKRKKAPPTSGQIRHWKATTRAAARAAAATRAATQPASTRGAFPTTQPITGP